MLLDEPQRRRHVVGHERADQHLGRARDLLELRVAREQAVHELDGRGLLGEHEGVERAATALVDRHLRVLLVDVVPLLLRSKVWKQVQPILPPTRVVRLAGAPEGELPRRAVGPLPVLGPGAVALVRLDAPPADPAPFAF